MTVLKMKLERHVFFNEKAFKGIGHKDGAVLIQLDIPVKDVPEADMMMVRLLPDNARALANMLLKAADEEDGGNSYQPN